jgi:hypothetical protein
MGLEYKAALAGVRSLQEHARAAAAPPARAAAVPVLAKQQ